MGNTEACFQNKDSAQSAQDINYAMKKKRPTKKQNMLDSELENESVTSTEQAY